MPLVESTQEEKEDPIAARRRRAAERQAGGNGGNGSSGKNSKPAPISHSDMAGLPQGIPVGDVTLVMKSPKIGKMAQLVSRIWAAWPYGLIMAALADREMGGELDPEAIARTWTSADRNNKPDAEETTADDVREWLRALANSFAMGDKYATECLAGMGSVLEMLCKPLPAPPDELPQWIADNFTLPELADLLRAVFDTVGGFPGDLRDRFPGRS